MGPPDRMLGALERPVKRPGANSVQAQPYLAPAVPVAVTLAEPGPVAFLVVAARPEIAVIAGVGEQQLLLALEIPVAARRVFASGLAPVGQAARLPRAIGCAVARRIRA